MSNQQWKTISTLNTRQITNLCQMYQQEWWSKGRQKADVVKMLESSDIIVALCNAQNLELVAFSRVITDFVYRGFILDVIVTPNCRGQGLGRKLLENIINHPQLQKVESLILFCKPEMVGFYQQWDFSEAPADLRLMGKTVR